MGFKTDFSDIFMEPISPMNPAFRKKIIVVTYIY